MSRGLAFPAKGELIGNAPPVCAHTRQQHPHFKDENPANCSAPRQLMRKHRSASASPG